MQELQGCSSDRSSSEGCSEYQHDGSVQDEVIMALQGNGPALDNAGGVRLNMLQMSMQGCCIACHVQLIL